MTIRPLTKVEEAILNYWGERCPTFDPECPVCDAWLEFDMNAAFEASFYPCIPIPPTTLNQQKTHAIN